MTASQICIEPYTPELLPQVAGLLRHLWGPDVVMNQRLFRWKYDDNPFAATAAGIVAIRDGQVVGFRGYFPTAWSVPERGQQPVRVLCPGDTCVDPACRQRGLSLTMADAASELYAAESALFLNTTATRASLPGYRKLGFVALARKVYGSAYSLLGLTRYLLTYSRRPRPEVNHVLHEQEAGFELTTEPRAEEMAALAAGWTDSAPRLAPVRTAECLKWRFRRPGAAYAFGYAYAGGALRGYLALGLSPNRRRAYVLDFLDTDGRSIVGLLQHLIDRQHFDILSIAELSQARSGVDWARLDFRSAGLLRRLERRRTGELPLLVRPVRVPAHEPDWRLGGLDVREPHSWCFREIASDAM